MRSSYQASVFPHDLDAPAARSLGAQFAMQEWLNCVRYTQNICINPTPQLPELIQRNGLLDRLHFYCAIVTASFPHKHDPSLLSCVDRLHGSAIVLRSQPPPLLCSILSKDLKDFFLVFIPYLEELKCDENTMFYLIEHKDEINQAVHPRAVEQLFARWYASGPSHLRSILREGYTRRGFGHFYEKNKPLIETIEWTADEWNLPCSV